MTDALTIDWEEFDEAKILQKINGYKKALTKGAITITDLCQRNTHRRYHWQHRCDYVERLDPKRAQWIWTGVRAKCGLLNQFLIFGKFKVHRVGSLYKV